jgi:hypothetical protein
LPKRIPSFPPCLLSTTSSTVSTELGVLLSGHRGQYLRAGEIKKATYGGLGDR